MPDLIGKTLGQYQILREIGRGGMAIVYEAYQPVLARRVALKVLLPHLSSDPSLVQRFLQEARSAAALTHANIVTIHDVVEQDGQYYIVMQYLPGQPLSQLIQQTGRVPLVRATRIVAQIASALDYAHSRGVVHRDVKPPNIIAGPDDQATLTDFGIARAAEASRLTYAGTVVGTPEYMSPEQAQGEQVGPASDIYALGIVLYEMLSGQLPFNAPSTPSLLYKQVHERPGPVRVYAPELPVGVEKVLGKALAKQPGERFRTAAELAEALRALPPPRATPISPARGVRPVTPVSSEATRLIRPDEARTADRPSRPKTGPAPTVKRSVGWLVPVMAAAIVILVGAAIALWPRASSPPPPPTIFPATSVAPTEALPVVVAPTSTLEPSPLPRTIATAPATLVPTATPPLPTRTAAPATTEAPAATSTPRPTASVTPEPPATATPLPPPTPTQPPARPVGVSLPAPILAGPEDRASVMGRVTFVWNWSGPTLAADQGFEIRIWREGQPDHFGAAEPVRTTSATIDVNGAYGVTLGGTGAYLWTVAVVRLAPNYGRIGPEAAPRVLQIQGQSVTPRPPPP